MSAIQHETHLYSCGVCGTSFNPGQHCECPEGSCIFCNGGLFDADAVLTKHGAAHEDCAEAHYDERDSTASLGLEGR